MTPEPADENPAVTVLMPVYNAEPYVAEAIGSILAQTFTDFEFLIIDDCSTDNSVAVIESCPDPRIRLLRNATNKRIAATLNVGIDQARGRLIARMDADDVAHPERLQRQVEYMDAHPDVGISGTWAQVFGGVSFVIRHPDDDAMLRARLLFNTVFAHPTVIMRADVLREAELRYPAIYLEDYALWWELSWHTKMGNVQAVLLNYRVTPTGFSQSGNPQVRRGAYAEIDRRALERLGITPTAVELDIHNMLRNPTGPLTDAAEQWLRRIREANARATIYDPSALDEVLRERWCLYCYVAHGWGPRKYLRYLRSPLARSLPLAAPAQLRAMAKFCLWKLFTVIR